MEVHVQLTTASKMFCGCSADYASAPPNTLTCPVCLGLPGALPVINRRAVEFAIMTGLALNCRVPHLTKWDRKNYPYPDLPKGYQISQYDMPVTRGGWLLVRSEGIERRVGIRRAHLEEDTGKLVHAGGRSYVDFNRSGVPLLEIVSEPDLRSAEEARQYLVQLRTILRYLGVSTGNMEEGAMRCEANISLRPVGTTGLPATYVEVKNLNSFRAVKAALEYEIERQARVLDSGGQVERVTVGWDEARGVTVVQRTKEEAHDYRYFPEPDLPALEVGRDWVEELRERLPELPDARAERLSRQYGLSAYDAAVLTEERELADYYEDAVATAGDAGRAKALANWITGPLFRLMNLASVSIGEVKVRPGQLAELADLVERGVVNLTTGRQVLQDMFERGVPASAIIREKGLAQITDESRLEELAREAVASNPRAVEDYRAGKTQAVKFLLGQVMRATGGQASPQAVEEILRRILEQ
ncbi:MAG: Asp-tRNA(Asn)/Glu-tRNA(Gln) amidotransferase subunit GatB [Anaerolineae bacterium]|nr:Asp-tRNA(Asn)/Glu-tRNA(Gln) amidotransferase subunit GatB [Anaerolineae bacterium]